MDWEQVINDMFKAAVDGISKSHPEGDHLEWELYWNTLMTYKTYRENKAKAGRDRPNENWPNK